MRYFIGPMSKNVVDSVIDFCSENGVEMAFIPSRRQIEMDGGYVNNWKTEEFCNYVRSNSNATIVRDHSGPNQGRIDDDGYDSLREDCNFMDMIHIDPWKKYTSVQDGLRETIKMIEFCISINPQMTFEVGTEQSIRNFELDELEEFVSGLKQHLSDKVFSRIKYLVIQSGTSLKGNKQTGNYDPTRLENMLKLCKRFGLLSKEHNGDYIPNEIIQKKFELGLDAINIAPEFGVIETDTYLQHIKNPEIFDLYFRICYESKKWMKWVGKDFDPFEEKKSLIRICGHYVLSEETFIKEIKSTVPNIDLHIRNNIKTKLNKLYGKA